MEDGIGWVALGSCVTTILGAIVIGFIKLWNNKTDTNRTLKKDTIEHYEKLYERQDREIEKLKRDIEKLDREKYDLERQCAEERRLSAVDAEKKEARIQYLEGLLTDHNIPFRQRTTGTDTHRAIGNTSAGGKDKKNEQ